LFLLIVSAEHTLIAARKLDHFSVNLMPYPGGPVGKASAPAKAEHDDENSAGADRGWRQQQALPGRKAAWLNRHQRLRLRRSGLSAHWLHSCTTN
jgi:hypothetical protein